MAILPRVWSAAGAVSYGDGDGNLRALSVAVATSLVLGVAVAPASSVAATPPDPASTDPATMTIEQASVAARRSGKPVEATASASETTTVMTNPDGSVTLRQSATPTRKKVDGAWQDLDATLRRNSDGTWSPRLSQAPLRLSGGGTAPLASVGVAALNASLGAPVALPEPTVTGATATYPEVYPGVDLAVTARPSGGFSEVFVVRDAKAAANPALTTLDLPLTATGMTIATDAAGNLTGRDGIGRTVLAAPAPTMWDSSGAGRPAGSGARAASSFRGPGLSARTARIGAAAGSGRLRLTPDRGLLTGSATKYPVYIDPSFTWLPAAGTFSGWATITKKYPSTNYWKTTPDPYGRMQVGNAGSILSRTLINFNIPTSTLANATINTAQLKITETYAYSCTPAKVSVFAPSPYLTSSNATWNAWSGVSLGSSVDDQTVAKGYNSSCPAGAVAFDVRSVVTADVKNAKKVRTFALVAGDESSTSGWKEFLETSPTLAITYNHKPNKPSGLRTSPTTSCTGTTIGEGAVTLYATVSDPDKGAVGVSFKMWKSGTSTFVVPATDPQKLYYTSGSTAVLKVPMETFRAHTPAGGSATFSWQVQATDYGATSDWSTTCNFIYDRTRPGAPEIELVDEAGATVGTPLTVNLKPPTGTTPSTYIYQLNGGPYRTAAATAGTATISVTPTRFTNTVTVSSQSAGGNVGDSASVTFNAQRPRDAADGDLDGDDIADLVAAGAGTATFPAGLWLSPGQRNGEVTTALTNIGSRGSGGPTGTVADFTGAQVVTGKFTGAATEDVLVYYPGGTKNPGGGVILHGNGDGATIQAQLDENYSNINGGTFQGFDFNDLQDIKDPVQLVNAGATYPGYADLLGIAGKPDNSYLLTFYPNGGGLVGGYNDVVPLANTTPTGGRDWNTWTLATAQTGSGTAMFLRQAATGQLYLWNRIGLDTDTGSLTYEQHRLSTTWNAGKALTLRAADLDRDGTADLQAYDANLRLTTWLVTGLTATGGTASPAAQSQQTMVASSHSWMLDDCDPAEDLTCATVNAGQVRDSSGTLLNAGASTARWTSGELFSPAAAFNGTNATIATTGPAVTTDADFSVSAWAMPTAHTTVVASQDGVSGTGFKIFATSIDGSWCFAMQQADTPNASAVWDIVRTPAGNARIGMWSHLTATYQRSTGKMSLYVNGELGGTATHTKTWSAKGPFRIGATHTTASGGLDSYFRGQIAGVHTYNSMVNPTKPITPTGAWRFNEGAGTVAADSGTGVGSPPVTNPATLTNVGWTAGRVDGGRAGSFNGTTSHATTGLKLDSSKSFTVATWVRATDLSVNRSVVTRAGSNYASFYLMYQASSKKWLAQLAADTGNVTTYVASSTAAAQAGAWTHLTAVFDAGAKTLTLYVNGVANGTVANVTAFNDPGGATWIGRSGGTYFAGDIADVRVWDRALDPARVHAVANP